MEDKVGPANLLQDVGIKTPDMRCSGGGLGGDGDTSDQSDSSGQPTSRASAIPAGQQWRRAQRIIARRDLKRLLPAEIVT
ncbi:hypothetical protein PG997_005583 [Apiospora hydei]|uniref:Uncharacterized protein n=1 Tax=Apiospora hydei TaxID=1337664 RepID=A0ABR1WLE4_9PEZI